MTPDETRRAIVWRVLPLPMPNAATDQLRGGIFAFGNVNVPRRADRRHAPPKRV